MNQQQHERLRLQIAADHECSPYLGGCHLPHYWYNSTAPRYRALWPAPSAASKQIDDIRLGRDWALGADFGADEETL